MIDLKPYGAFIENTVRPLFEELRLILKELEDRGIKLDYDTTISLINIISQKHIECLIIKSISGVIICALICFTVWKTLP